MRFELFLFTPVLYIYHSNQSVGVDNWFHCSVKKFWGSRSSQKKIWQVIYLNRGDGNKCEVYLNQEYRRIPKTSERYILVKIYPFFLITKIICKCKNRIKESFFHNSLLIYTIKSWFRSLLKKISYLIITFQVNVFIFYSEIFIIYQEYEEEKKNLVIFMRWLRVNKIYKY